MGMIMMKKKEKNEEKDTEMECSWCLCLKWLLMENGNTAWVNELQLYGKVVEILQREMEMNT